MLVGHEGDDDGGKIWIAGAGAEARELRNLEVDHVVALSARVRPRLQLIVGDGLLPIFQCRRRLVAHSRSCVSSWQVQCSVRYSAHCTARRGVRAGEAAWRWLAAH